MNNNRKQNNGRQVDLYPLIVKTRDVYVRMTWKIGRSDNDASNGKVPTATDFVKQFIIGHSLFTAECSFIFPKKTAIRNPD